MGRLRRLYDRRAFKDFKGIQIHIRYVDNMYFSPAVSPNNGDLPNQVGNPA